MSTPDKNEFENTCAVIVFLIILYTLLHWLGVFPNKPAHAPPRPAENFVAALYHGEVFDYFFERSGQVWEGRAEVHPVLILIRVYTRQPGQDWTLVLESTGPTAWEESNDVPEIGYNASLRAYILTSWWPWDNKTPAKQAWLPVMVRP